MKCCESGPWYFPEPTPEPEPEEDPLDVEERELKSKLMLSLTLTMVDEVPTLENFLSSSVTFGTNKLQYVSMASLS